MNKSTGILLALMSLFLGVIIGFLLAPMKNGLAFGNNSGNTTTYKGYDYEMETNSADDDDSLEN